MIRGVYSEDMVGHYRGVKTTYRIARICRDLISSFAVVLLVRRLVVQ